MPYNLRSACAMSQEEHSMAYMEESDIEDGIVNVNDIKQSTELCHQHNHLPPTKVCKYIGKFVTDFPVPPTVEDEFNHNKNTITTMNNDTNAALKQMFPEMQTSTTKFCLLTEFLQKFLDKAKLPLQDSERKKQAIVICSTIIQQYLNCEFCQLLTRWAQKKKMDYPKDNINTILVLISHFPSMPMSTFLTRCCTYKISPWTL